MCSYCTCLKNMPVPGMRVGPWGGDPTDHQTEISYSWTGYQVTGNIDNPNATPPVFDQNRQQRIGGNGAQAGVSSG